MSEYYRVAPSAYETGVTLTNITAATTTTTNTFTEALRELSERIKVLEAQVNLGRSGNVEINDDDPELGNIDDSLSEFIEEFDVRGDD